MEVLRVQSVASLSKRENTIPSEFIRSAAEQPAATTVQGVVLEVPVIDIGSNLNGEKEIVKLVSEASRDWGIFQVVNHGISNEIISNLQKVGKEFFELPEDEKELIAKTPESGVEGYGTKLQKETDGRKGWVDHLFHKIWPTSEITYDFWPKKPPGYRSYVLISIQFVGACCFAVLLTTRRSRFIFGDDSLTARALPGQISSCGQRTPRLGLRFLFVIFCFCIRFCFSSCILFDV